MAQDPAILFYTADFLIGTMLMSDEQKGKYITLLCLQHQNSGTLSAEDMSKICQTHDKDIFDKFKQNSDGRYYNERMLKEMNKRSDYSNSRKINRLSKISQKKPPTHDQHVSDTSLTHDRHMENENTNTTIDIKGTGIKGKEENISNNDNSSSSKDVIDTCSTHVNHMSSKEEIQSDINNKKYEVDEFLEVYFKSPKYSAARDRVAISGYVDLDQLREWAKIFNDYLISSGSNLDKNGKTVKQESDWAKHFKLWFDKQDKKIDPKLFNEEKNKQNGKRNNGTAAGVPITSKNILQPGDNFWDK